MFSGLVLALSVVLQFVAAGLALRLIKITEWRLAWSAVAAALVLMGTRRSITLFRLMSGDVTHPPDFSAELVALLISVLMLFGVAAIGPLFAATRRAQQAQAESEKQSRIIAETAPVPLTVTRLSDGTVLYANRQAGDLMGLSVDEIIGKKSADHYQNPTERNAFLAELNAHRIVRGREMAMRKADGSPISLVVSAQTLNFEGEPAVLSVFQDITDRKNMETALRTGEERMRGILANIPGVVYRRVRNADGTIKFTYVSSGVREMYGYEPENYHSDSSLMMRSIHPDDRDRFLEDIEEAERTLEPFDSQMRIVTKSGKVKWHRSISRPRLLANGGVEWDGLILDITAQMEAEEQLRRMQRMEAIGRLTGGIAHDFNNLLAVIQGNLELLDDRLEDNPELRELTGPALRSVKRGSGLTNRLLSFARKKPLTSDLVDLNELVVDLSGLLSRTLGKTVLIETDLADDLWDTVVDAGELESALLNLAVNARDAMPEGGCLRIETANAHLDKAYCERHPDAAPGDYAVLTVADSGCGMPGEIMEQVFEPFFTTKEPGHGTGLGLSMVYGFAQQSGGHVAVHSEPGEGTTFAIYLRRAQNGAAEPALCGKANGVPKGRGESILVVEDDPDVRSLSTRTLTGLGYRVIQAEDGPSALDALMRAPEAKLLFTDLVLPRGMTGADLAVEARRLRSDLKVLFTSGYAEGTAFGDSNFARKQPFIGKPFQIEELARKVRSILAE